MTLTRIVGGEVLDANGRRKTDLVVNDETGLIVDTAGEQVLADLELDATGCLVLPGLVDIHAHLRQPGSELSETIESAALAAAVGGYTAVVAMPDTDPCVDNAAAVNDVLALAKAVKCEVVPAGAATRGRKGVDLAPVGELVAVGVRLFSDSGSTIQNAGVMRRVLEYVDGIGAADGLQLVVAQCPQMDTLTGLMNEGALSSTLGLSGQPALAEELMVARDIGLAQLVGARLHLQGLSTAGSVEAVRRAKASGASVTAEVTPHHLVLTEQACATYDPNTKVSPPLRTETDRQALWAGLADGTIDAVATDHGPCPADSKERPFDHAPFGVIGLETALPLLATEIESGDIKARIQLDQVIAALSWQPAAIVGLSNRHGGPLVPGASANICVFDPNKTWTLNRSTMVSRSSNTPFAGRELHGAVRHTVFAGTPVVANGAVVDSTGTDGAAVGS